VHLSFLDLFSFLPRLNTTLDILPSAEFNEKRWAVYKWAVHKRLLDYRAYACIQEVVNTTKQTTKRLLLPLLK